MDESRTRATQRTPPLTVDRTGTDTYVARNARGAEVRIGLPGSPGTFTPTELMQIALAACSALSAEPSLRHALGDDVEAHVEVTALKREAENRLDALSVVLEADLSGLDAERAARLAASARRRVESLCTVGRTLAAGASHTFVLEDGPGTASKP